MLHWRKRGMATMVFMLALALTGKAQTSVVSVDSTLALRPVFTIEFSHHVNFDNVRQEDYQSLLALFLVTANGPSKIPVSGEYLLDNGQLSFQPLTDLGQGLSFSVQQQVSDGQVGRRTYRTPEAVLLHAAPPQVLKVFPESDVLPENILCFHVLFDRPMFKDQDAHQRAKIFSEGVEVPMVWKHMSHWIQNGQLLVLMVHPGRVKQGISYLGKAFEAGKEYTLLIEQEITDPQGRTLVSTFKKEFKVAKVDHQIPKIKKSRIAFPEAMSSAPIRLNFSEPMDFACMLEGLEVIDETGQLLEVKIEHISDHQYTVTPAAAWSAGTYQLVFDKVVSDLSGNRFNRKFETTKKPTQEELNKELIFEFVL